MNAIFISYRRSDSQDIVGRLYEHVAARFGRGNVFKDVDSVPLGLDFRKQIKAAVSACKVVLAVIGPTWLDATDNSNNRRLNQADDFVRIELETALDLGIPVVPVLVMGASLPATDDLPESLREIPYRNAGTIRSDPDFTTDMSRLLRDLDRKLNKAVETQRRTPQKILEYVYVDRSRLRSYIEQLDAPGLEADIPSWEPSTAHLPHRAQSDSETISRLLDHLEKCDQLDLGRPKDDSWEGKPFALEEMVARKAIFPSKSTEHLPSLREIAVWVSDPEAADLTLDRFRTSGTFLYLIESYWHADAHRYGTTSSGLSALMLIIDELAGLEVVSQSSKGRFGGRFSHNSLSPIEILKEIGARVQPERRIRSLYRKRYISDEQYFDDTDGVSHRSFDVFAYPIFIEAV